MSTTAAPVPTIIRLDLPKLFTVRHSSSNDIATYLMAAKILPTRDDAIKHLEITYDEDCDYITIEEKNIPPEMLAAIEALLANAKRA